MVQIRSISFDSQRHAVITIVSEVVARHQPYGRRRRNRRSKYRCASSSAAGPSVVTQIDRVWAEVNLRLMCRQAKETLTEAQQVYMVSSLQERPELSCPGCLYCKRRCSSQLVLTRPFGLAEARIPCNESINYVGNLLIILKQYRLKLLIRRPLWCFHEA